ncbi:MFS general substrate transporter [Neolentinus lepideus HHB14362 ss-1]|uniref:MFS general substrate transporter n=1 Tax=Neolentinus lepideus HHB14362 ss-1 TaxID=1314782 RepID=A0A165T846_9AGAM|nr:MFS general substrate transporter [Neolentinus lepideus HHB14362 ss-1]
MSSLVRLAQLGLVCLSIAGNALCAGGIFTFPLISPALATHLKLTQPQLTTIVLAGMVGQYPFAAIVGKCIDKYGPWACSLIASILFSSSFGSFSLEIAKTADDVLQPSASSFQRLTVFFFMAGLGTVFSYFSALFAASKNFPDYIGVASGATMALFGLSPLFLSVIASTFFTNPDAGLQVSSYLMCLAVLVGLVNLCGAVILRSSKKSVQDREESGAETSQQVQDVEEPDERAPLLPGKAPTATIDVSTVDEGATVVDLLKNRHFWVLVMITLLVCGACEMIMSNTGSIVLSLPQSSNPGMKVTSFQRSGTDVATSAQVRLLSLANTISRLFFGPLADYISPVASYLPSGERAFPRQHFISRVAFLSLSSMLLAITLFSVQLNVRTQADLWLLSVGTGMTYGTTFTVLPSIISSIWGLSNMARNFGILSYAPFIGTPLFSYLYAFVATSHAPDNGICQGASCWRFTFWVATGASIVAFCGSLYLWREWKGRL